jgi:hypothetical protein
MFLVNLRIVLGYVVVNVIQRHVFSIAVVDVAKCRVLGRGIQPNGVRIGDLAVFQVHTLGAGPGDLKVSVEGPNDVGEPANISQVLDISFKFACGSAIEYNNVRGIGH